MKNHPEPYLRESCPNGKGTFVYLPDTDLCYVFRVAGNVQILTDNYKDGVACANAIGCDFPAEMSPC